MFKKLVLNATSLVKDQAGGQYVRSVRSPTMSLFRDSFLALATRHWQQWEMFLRLVGYNSGSQRAQKLCNEIRRECNIEATPIFIGLDHPRHVNNRFHDIIAEHGPIGYLVNNAGVNDRSSGFSLDAKRLDEILTINLKSPLLLTSAAGSYFVKNGIKGAIVNITSVHDKIPISGGALYCASKGDLQLPLEH